MTISSTTRRVTAIAATAFPLGLGALAAVPAQAQTAAPAPVQAAAATASPAVTISAGDCTFTVTVNEDRDSSGAYVDAHVVTDTCGIGIEGAIKAPAGTPASYGGDVHNAGQDSVTGHIPINSGNHHGFRAWYNNTWNYFWRD